jgi:hypothetical protein
MLASCNLVEVYRRFRGACCLPIQDDEPESSHLRGYVQGSMTCFCALYSINEFSRLVPMKPNSQSLELTILELIVGAGYRVVTSFCGDLLCINATTGGGPPFVNRRLSRCAWCVCSGSNIDQVVPDVTLVIKLATLSSVNFIDIKEFHTTDRSLKRKQKDSGQVRNATRFGTKLSARTGNDVIIRGARNFTCVSFAVLCTWLASIFVCLRYKSICRIYCTAESPKVFFNSLKNEVRLNI